MSFTFEPESLASLENLSSSSPPPSSVAQHVALCLVTTSLAQSTGCGTTGALPTDGSTSALVPTTSSPSSSGPPPPVPGATVVGVLIGVVVTNQAALSCLENDNQSADLGDLATETITSELLVWKLPAFDNQLYYYVVMTTTPTAPDPADCTTAVLAFAIPSETPPAAASAANVTTPS